MSPIFKLHSMSHPKCDVKADIHMNGELVETYIHPDVTQVRPLISFFVDFSSIESFEHALCSDPNFQIAHPT